MFLDDSATQREGLSLGLMKREKQSLRQSHGTYDLSHITVSPDSFIDVPNQFPHSL